MKKIKVEILKEPCNALWEPYRENMWNKSHEKLLKNAERNSWKNSRVNPEETLDGTAKSHSRRIQRLTLR